MGSGRHKKGAHVKCAPKHASGVTNDPSTVTDVSKANVP